MFFTKLSQTKISNGTFLSISDGEVVEDMRQGGGSPSEMVKLNGQQLRDSLRPQNVTAAALKSGAPHSPAAGEHPSNVWTSLGDTGCGGGGADARMDGCFSICLMFLQRRSSQKFRHALRTTRGQSSPTFVRFLAYYEREKSGGNYLPGRTLT